MEGADWGVWDGDVAQVACQVRCNFHLGDGGGTGLVGEDDDSPVWGGGEGVGEFGDAAVVAVVGREVLSQSLEEAIHV